jgi:hypothetical protein
MESLKLKKNLATGIKKSLQDDTFKTGIQDDLDHQIANICYKTLRYIDIHFGDYIYNNTTLNDDKTANIQKLLIYIFIMYYFHSSNNNIRRYETSQQIIEYENIITITCNRWFKENIFATATNTISSPTTYRPFKITLKNAKPTDTDSTITNYVNKYAKIYNNVNLQKLIANAVVSIHKNDYKILTALLSDTYDISDDKFEIGLKHPNIQDKIIKANNFISNDYGNPLNIQDANCIKDGMAHIIMSNGGNHYPMDNIVFSLAYNKPVVTADKKYVKVLDFMPVKNVTDAATNVTSINTMTNDVLIANITTNAPQLTLKALDANDPKKNYFSHKLVQNNDAKYEHQFNSNGTINDNNSLKFELYVIK